VLEGSAKVGDLGLAALGQEDVPRLHVAMDDAVLEAYSRARMHLKMISTTSSEAAGW